MTAPGPDPRDALSVARLWRALRSPFHSAQTFTGYCLIAWHVALIPSILLTLLAFAVVDGTGGDVARLQKPADDLTWRSVLVTVCAAPLIESLLLALLLRVLLLATRNAQALATVSALAWGVLHAMFYPMWFFGTVWSFYVFSRGYLAWRPVSFKHALGAAAVPHVLVNSSALLMQFFSRS